jgi:hypothetical protein
MTKHSVLILIAMATCLTLSVVKVFAETFEYSANGFKIRLIIVSKGDVMQVGYTLYNTSDNELLYSPKCQITNNYTEFYGVELGINYYTFDASHSTPALSELRAKDSVSFNEQISLDTNKRKIIVSFDCLMPHKLSKKRQQRVLKLLATDEMNKDWRRIDYFDYIAYYTDWFRWELPMVKLSR